MAERAGYEKCLGLKKKLGGAIKINKGVQEKKSQGVQENITGGERILQGVQEKNISARSRAGNPAPPDQMYVSAPGKTRQRRQEREG